MAYKKTAKQKTQRNTQNAIDEKVKILKRHLPELKKYYGVAELGIFGSFVRGEQSRKSDLDILVEFEHVPTLFGFIRLEQHLSQTLGIKVDLVMKDILKQNIGRYILKEVIPVS